MQDLVCGYLTNSRASAHDSGVKTTEAICALGKRHGIDLPLTEAVYKVVHNGAAPAAVVRELMTRALREE